MGCDLLVHDLKINLKLVSQYQVPYVGLDQLLSCSDLVSLHVPLVAGTRHLINEATLSRMKRGSMLINTASGAIVDTEAVLRHLTTRHLGYFGMDVYETKAFPPNRHAGFQ